MNQFILNDIREFCLTGLDDKSYLFLNNEYVPKYSKVFVWKILKCNEILKLKTYKCDDYINEIEKSKVISLERRNEIWKFVLPIYRKLKEYSSLNFKPTDLYLCMSDNNSLNSNVKEEITTMLRKSGAHSWTGYISPISEKFWVEGDFTFSEFIERISDTNILKEWWDFSQNKKPKILEE